MMTYVKNVLHFNGVPSYSKSRECR